jgi:hypothetical protein
MKSPLPEYAVGAGGDEASIWQLENATFDPIYSASTRIRSASSPCLIERRAQPPRTHRSLIAALAASRPLIVLHVDNSSKQRRTASDGRQTDQNEKHF